MALSQKETDIQMLLAAGCHLGTKNCSFQVGLAQGGASGPAAARAGGHSAEQAAVPPGQQSNGRV